MATMLVALLASQAAAESALDAQLWDHNGSSMRFVTPSSGQLSIIYEEPRAGISSTVRSGDVLFSGVRNGNDVYGQAFVFKRGCLPAPYAVRGDVRIINNRLVLTLRGAAPQRRGCRVVGYSERSSNAELLFISDLSSDRSAEPELAAGAVTAGDATIGTSLGCDGLNSQLRAIVAATRLTIPRSAQVGQSLRVAWQSRPPTERVAAYLVVTASLPVRISPTSTAYALHAHARAPFDILIGTDQTRVFIPLHGTAQTMRGTIELTPLQAALLQVEVHVAVAAPSCASQTAQMASAQLTPRPRPAELAGLRAFEPVDAKRYLRSPDQSRLAVIADDEFALEETATGTELGRYRGINPVFSPTGRFLAFESLTKRNEHYNDFKFIDAVDGRVVATLDGHSVSWDQKDSYVLIDKFYLGDLRIFNAAASFQDCKTNVQPYGFNPRVRVFRFDLDNNVVLVKSAEADEGSMALPLTSCLDTYREGLAYYDIPRFDSQVKNLVRSFQMTPYRLPTEYETEHGRRIFNLADWLHGNAGESGE